MTTFEKVFEINFQHEYFNYSNPTSSIQLGPSILNGSPAMQLRSTENGCFIFRPTPPSSTESKPELLALCIPIHFIDPNFFYYTNITIAPSSIIYFSTDQAKDGIIQSQDALQLPLQPSRFLYPMELSSLKSLTSIQLISPDHTTQELPLPSAPYHNGLLIDVSNEIAGKYEIQFKFKDGKENISYTFFASDQFYQRPPAAVLECKLNLNSLVTNIKTVPYTLSFESRSTYWRYVFPNFTEEEWNTVEVESIKINNQTIVFQNTKQSIQLPNGQLTYAVLSSQPIPLMERPIWQVKLSSKRLSEGIILPYPQPTGLTKKPSDHGATNEGAEVFISDIFCYI